MKTKFYGTIQSLKEIAKKQGWIWKEGTGNILLQIKTLEGMNINYYSNKTLMTQNENPSDLCLLEDALKIVNKEKDLLGLQRESTAQSIEEKVINKIVDRRAKGLKKYGVSMERTDLEFNEWLSHLQEELLDGAIYIEKIMNQVICKNID